MQPSEWGSRCVARCSTHWKAEKISNRKLNMKILFYIFLLKKKTEYAAKTMS